MARAASGDAKLRMAHAAHADQPSAGDKGRACGRRRETPLTRPPTIRERLARRLISESGFRFGRGALFGAGGAQHVREAVVAFVARVLIDLVTGPTVEIE